MAKGSFVLFAILLLFVLAISEIEAIPKLCEKSSKTYSGKCDNNKCDSKCIEWEKAAHGACHKREGKDSCFCYHDCSKTPPPGKGDPPAKGGSSPPKAGPPSKGGSPPSKADPPSKGGSPPPKADPPAKGGSPPPAAGDSPPPPAAGDSPPPPPADGGAPPPPAPAAYCTKN